MHACIPGPQRSRGTNVAGDVHLGELLVLAGSRAPRQAPAKGRRQGDEDPFR